MRADHAADATTTPPPRPTPTRSSSGSSRTRAIAARPRRAASSQALLDSGEARARVQARSPSTHADGPALASLVGLGARDALRRPSARAWPPRPCTGARRSSGRARSAGSCPHHVDRRARRGAGRGDDAGRLPLRPLQVRAGRGRRRRRARRADRLRPRRRRRGRRATRRVVAEAVNAARDLQNTPANDLTPTALAERARGARRESASSVEVEGREGIDARAGWARSPPSPQGSDAGAGADHAALRRRRRAPGRVLGFVGKAVTFDSGGISIKPAAKMAEMKFDMSRRRGGDRGASAAIAAAAAARPRRRASSARPRTCRRPRDQARRHRHAR